MPLSSDINLDINPKCYLNLEFYVKTIYWEEYLDFKLHLGWNKVTLSNAQG